MEDNNGIKTYSVPDGVLKGGVDTVTFASTDPGGNVKFNLFFDIILIYLILYECKYLEILMD